MQPTIGNAFLSEVSSRWWVFVLRGIAAILFAICAFAIPSASLYALVIVWGAYAVVDGASSLMVGASRGRAGYRWGWTFFEGLIGIAAGIGTFLYPGITARVLLFVIAFWAVFTGIAEIAAAISLRKVIRNEWLLALGGVLSIAFGVLLVVYPSAGALSVVWMIGAYALVFGVVLLGLGFRLNRLHRESERQVPTGGVPTAA